MRAAVELGSSSTRLMVVDEEGTIRTRMEARTAVAKGMVANRYQPIAGTSTRACEAERTWIGRRVGENVVSKTDRTYRIVSEGFEPTLDALRHFRAKLQAEDVADVQAVATGAFREACNGNELLMQASEVLRCEVRLMPYEEEGRTAAFAARKSTGLKTATVADLGGWTCELVDLHNQVHSMPIGCIAMSHLLKHETNNMKDTCIEIVRKELQQRCIEHIHSHPMLILGGTATSIAAMHLQLPKYDSSRVNKITLSRETIADLSIKETKADYWVERRDTMKAGAYTLMGIMSTLDVEEATVSDVDLLEGLLLLDK
mmetsp:Transcript_785/g.3097  ORF Transcript_785/g.3097 Transcript_785/m.3097 type:complete len:315 (+) Transcript_785:71-1015(+)